MGEKIASDHRQGSSTAMLVYRQRADSTQVIGVGEEGNTFVDGLPQLTRIRRTENTLIRGAGVEKLRGTGEREDSGHGGGELAGVG